MISSSENDRPGSLTDALRDLQRAWSEGEVSREDFARAIARAEAAEERLAELTRMPCGSEKHLLHAYLWRRRHEWVLEISGEINDCAFSARHTAPGAMVPEEVPGLPHLYRDVDASRIVRPLEWKKITGKVSRAIVRNGWYYEMMEGDDGVFVMETLHGQGRLVARAAPCGETARTLAQEDFERQILALTVLPSEPAEPGDTGVEASGP